MRSRLLALLLRLTAPLPLRLLHAAGRGLGRRRWVSRRPTTG
ncbi:MAG: hypothetical protein U5L11_02325 [Arhodomonas sp.]|nr:hypothetical protein [Arhodomonas sp.]